MRLEPVAIESSLSPGRFTQPRAKSHIASGQRLGRFWVCSMLAGWCLLAGCGRGPALRFGAGLPAVPASLDISQLEREMFHLVNRDREGKGLPRLSYDERLADVARFHSSDMRDKRFFAHDSPTTGSLADRLNAASYLSLVARENIAEAPDVASAQESLLNSPRHYENLMANDITHVGVGIVAGGVEAKTNYLFTQVFASPGERESADEARQTIVSLIDQARGKKGLGQASVHPRLTDLAEEHVGRLSASPSASELKQAGRSITEQLQEEPIAGVRGVLVGGQVLAQSSQFEMTPALLDGEVRHYGLAVDTIQSDQGRPMIKVLIVVGL